MNTALKLSKTFIQFFDSEKSSAILLFVCVIVAIAITNSAFGQDYLSFWQTTIGGLTLAQWVNDGLMAVFFLLIGLELEREFYVGELSSLKDALLPIVAAVGGMLVPAIIYTLFNQGSLTQAGFGIPMATDIAIALGVLALLGNRIPSALKVFLVAFAVIDDLGAIIIIALFYTAKLSLYSLFAALLVWTILILLNRIFKIIHIAPYVIGGVIMWVFMLQSGIHATIVGVMLAFAIPFSVKDDDEKSPSHKLEHFLHKPVSIIILPIFALANTGVIFDANSIPELISISSLGIMFGLLVGKPLGVSLTCYLAVKKGICQLPIDVNWWHIIGAGMLGGIGFTMSIFITNLAFANNSALINSAKMAILSASLGSAILGFIWLKFIRQKNN